jgi:hypothetical protein
MARSQRLSARCIHHLVTVPLHVWLHRNPLVQTRSWREWVHAVVISAIFRDQPGIVKFV